MLFFVLGLILSLIGIIFIIIDKKLNPWHDYEFIGALFIAFGLCIVIVLGAVALGINASEDTIYFEKIETYNMLNYRLEHQEDNIVGNEMLYSDIMDFNSWIYANRKWATNPWTNWFNYQSCLEIPIINYQRGN